MRRLIRFKGTLGELLDWLKSEGKEVADVAPGRLVLVGGDEVWRAGGSWLLGRPADLAVLWASV